MNSTIERMTPIPTQSIISGVQPCAPIADNLSGTIINYGHVVTVNIMVRINQTPGSTDTIITGLPVPVRETVITMHKRLGGGNYGVALSAGGNIYNMWEGIPTGEYTITFSYISNAV